MWSGTGLAAASDAALSRHPMGGAVVDPEGGGGGGGGGGGTNPLEGAIGGAIGAEGTGGTELINL